MITALTLALMLQEAGQESIYKTLRDENLFSPEVKKPPPKRDPTEAAREEKPPPPAAPKKSVFDVAGIVLDPKRQAYEALLCDREWEEAGYYKSGDTFHGAIVEEVGENGVTIQLEGKSKRYGLGDTFEILVAGRGSGRPSASRSSSGSEPARTDSSAGRSSGGGGLLDRFRRRAAGGSESGAPKTETTPAAAPSEAPATGLFERLKRIREKQGSNP
jgi:hypothetical protein